MENKSKIVYTRPEINALGSRPEKVSLAEFVSFPSLNMKEQRVLFKNASDELIVWALERLNQYVRPETELEKIVAEVLVPKALAILKKPVPKPVEPNLDLAGFWNPLMMRFPKGVDLFSKWIDQYKETHRWRELMPSAKFHDLPLGLQSGLMELFFFDQIGGNFCFSNFTLEQQKEEYSKLFKFLHERTETA